MKVIKDTTRQHGAYSDTTGDLYIFCENGETVDSVLDRYVKPQREWFETKYSYVETLKSLEVTDWSGEKTKYEGTIVVLFARRVYLD